MTPLASGSPPPSLPLRTVQLSRCLVPAYPSQLSARCLDACRRPRASSTPWTAAPATRHPAPWPARRRPPRASSPPLWRLRAAVPGAASSPSSAWGAAPASSEQLACPHRAHAPRTQDCAQLRDPATYETHSEEPLNPLCHHASPPCMPPCTARFLTMMIARRPLFPLGQTTCMPPPRCVARMRYVHR